MSKVLYEELTPQEFRERIIEAPIAYLPLGTLEWHGEHMPFGADGIQSQGFFKCLAEKVGGIVLPMLFLGPDRVREENGIEYYGMDFSTNETTSNKYYTARQLDGSAYRVSDDVFEIILDSTMKQLKRAGFQIVVAHGHGPSTKLFQDRMPLWSERYSLQCFTCWGSEVDAEGLGIQVDHGAMNETSLVMALRPELVKMENLDQDLGSWPLAIGGKDPRIHASKELGDKIISIQAERMIKILSGSLKEVKP